MSLESIYGLRAIRDVARKIFIENGFRPRRIKQGGKLSHAKYLFSFYNEEGIEVRVFYHRELDCVIDCFQTKEKMFEALMVNVMPRALLLSLLEGIDSP
ncbi:unnamed protein product [marine sediment metagenome]|uniref:Uncharacterized protein n=1 Tax=marine sediment metagenome TaxID=412755 RepID=X1VP60_9ZZZZ